MRYLLSIYGAPYASQAPDTALKFAKALLEAGHDLQQVFFYGDAVLTASTLVCPPRDETCIQERWADFATGNGLELSVCVSASMRTGMLSQEEASRLGKKQWNMEPPFVLAGLGTFVEAMITADRCLFFGG